MAKINRIVYGEFANHSNLGQELEALKDPGAADCNICRATINRIFEFTYPKEFNHETIFYNASKIAQGSDGKRIPLQQQRPTVQKEVKRLQELFDFSGMKTQ